MANASPATLLSRRFPSKRAFITGAASGLGLAMAQLLARDGWTLGVLDLDREALERAVTQLRTSGAANVTAYTGDVAAHEFVAASITGFSQANQGLDVMVNNAGVAVAGAVEATPVDDWNWIVGINLLGVVWGCRAALPILKYGFRCGFLGLLHMDIISQRLEREFDLNIITTAPSVIYHVFKTDGTMLAIDNPTNLPSIGEIEHMEEPIVLASVYTPQEYVGTLMEVCSDKRGTFLDMQYEGGRVKLTYHMPLNEIIYDFFDQVKSRSRGYASFDYELKGYQESDLVKLDILLNGEICDAFTIIVHRDKAYVRGRGIAEKLVDVIPRQLFEIPIQAAIGGKVIARETVRAMRKDVLAKCYGGDITRKKKLLEKQKEGKKRMRQFGSVEVPSEAFMAVLKMDDK